MATAFYVLFESASGYGLFSISEQEEIGAMTNEVQSSLADFSRLQKSMKLIAFHPFDSAENALENINAITEHELLDDLKSFLESNISKGKKSKIPLGVIEPTLATAIQENLGITCRSDETIRELTRVIRANLTKFIKPLASGNLEQAQLGLGHSYSRSKVKFNPGRADNMIIQSIAQLDQMDKDLNTFSMRVKEWYSWHFPELKEVVKDNYMFAKCAAYIQDKSTLSEDKLEGLTAITEDEAVSKAVLKAARASMGMDTSEADMANIVVFTERIISLAEYRKQLYAYLEDKMATVAPNLSSLIGETVAARLIQKAGSLTSLAKCPASTVQILGAEKALFRALKTKGNTPKYGLIYHSSFIGRASAKNKGRISRYLANKCAIASRIDSFIEEPTKAYGEQLRDQVEERLKFYDTGEAPRKNVDVMSAVAEGLRKIATKDAKKKGGDASAEDEGSKKKKKKDKKRDRDEEAEQHEEAVEDAAEGDKKKKKKKKSKRASSSIVMHFEEALLGNTALAKDALKAERYVATNRFNVRKGKEAKFEKRWADRKSRISQLKGFRFFTLLKRVQVLGADYSKDGDEGNYVSMTVWEDKDCFDEWRTGDAFKEAHGGGGITDFLQLITTALFILDGKPKPAFYDGLLPAVSVDPMPFTSPDGWRKIEADGTNLLSPDVFLAQNRFVVKAGKQEVFEGRWSARESQLSSVPGFLGFYMLRRDAAKADDGYNYISTSIWRDIDSFKNWQSSPNFASAHASAGQSAAESIYEAPPRVAFYEGKLALSSVKGA